MAQKKEAPLSLKIAHELVYGLAHADAEEWSNWADFYEHALYEACEAQNINQEEYKLLIAIVQTLAPEEE